MTIFPIYDLKWHKIAHSKISAEEKQAATNEIKRTDIQISFDTIFIPESLMVDWVISPISKMKICLRLPAAGWVRIPTAPAF